MTILVSWKIGIVEVAYDYSRLKFEFSLGRKLTAKKGPFGLDFRMKTSRDFFSWIS